MTARGAVRAARWGAAAVGAAIAAACAGAPAAPSVGPATAAADGCTDAAAMAVWQRAQQTLLAASLAESAAAAAADAAACADLEQVVARCPDFARAQVVYQDVARRLGGEAEARMRAACAARSDDAAPLTAYLRARLLPTAYEQSAACNAVLAQHPTFAWARLSQARLARGQGRALAALESLAAALRDAPDLHEARVERAEILAQLGRDAEAAAEYRLYLAVEPADLVASRDFVRLLLYRLGRMDEAVPLLDRLEAQAPHDLDLRMDRAAVHWQRGDLQRSAAAYLSVLEARPSASRAALNLGLLYYEAAPRDAAARPRFWPAARAAFRWFLDGPAADGGVEQYERTLGVPFRMARIAELLGPESPASVRLQDLRWPQGG